MEKKKLDDLDEKGEIVIKSERKQGQIDHAEAKEDGPSTPRKGEDGDDDNSIPGEELKEDSDDTDWDDDDEDVLANNFNNGVVIIWEVTFLEDENVLSSEATQYAFDREQAPPGGNRFKQSIRNGLKKMVHKLGFRMTNSRSAYFASRDDERYKKMLAAVSEGEELRRYLQSFTGRQGADITRARRWLRIVLREQHNLGPASPPDNPELRNLSTPLLIMATSRLL